VRRSIFQIQTVAATIIIHTGRWPTAEYPGRKGCGAWGTAQTGALDGAVARGPSRGAVDARVGAVTWPVPPAAATCCPRPNGGWSPAFRFGAWRLASARTRVRRMTAGPVMVTVSVSVGSSFLGTGVVGGTCHAHRNWQGQEIASQDQIRVLTYYSLCLSVFFTFYETPRPTVLILVSSSVSELADCQCNRYVSNPWRNPLQA
jgi:hypothetical protein